MTYNLLNEPWIPVMWKCGKPGKVGIREVLEKAGEIREIAASNPMDRIAILRFLLAALYWCKGNPPDTDSAPFAGSFPADWFSKLDDNRDCFNLLGEGQRFYQDRNAQRDRASTDLIQEIPTGNNFWHFCHSTDRRDGLCVACCAMSLLRLPLFCVSGLPDLKSGINGTPPVYVVPWGVSLVETLRANWIGHRQLGDPAWVRPSPRPAPGEEVPLLTGLTLLARRVWLHEPTEPPGMCCGCGARQTALIRTCEYQSAGKQENELWDDPHVVYLDKTPRKSAKAPDLTAAGKFRMDRPWPDLLASIISIGKFACSHGAASLLIVGFATDQAKNIDVWERKLELSSTASISAVLTPKLQQWSKQGWSIGKRIEEMTRSEVTGTSTVAAIRPHVEGRVSAKTDELLSGTEEAWHRAAEEYRPMMEMLAKSLSPGFTTAAVQRRKQITGVLPNMRPKAAPTDKPSRKKGGKK